MDMDVLNQDYMAKSSKTKTDYIKQLQLVVAGYSTRLTVKQLRQLIKKYG